MREIVGIGACVFDTLISLPHYPKEDTKLRADNVKSAGGGPAATGLVTAAKLGVSIEGATLYCTHQPCVICAKMIVNSGITRIVYEKGYPDEFSREIIAESGVLLERFTEDDWKL